MSNIDKQALRQTAEKAQEHGVFNMDIHSETVLALLDELEPIALAHLNLNLLCDVYRSAYEEARHDGLVNWEAAASLAEENSDLKRKLEAAEKRVAELSSSVIAPGKMRCAGCGFVLTKNNINMNAGTITAGDSKTEPCPNGCGPLWPVTWKEQAIEMRDSSEQWFEELQEARQRVAELEALARGVKQFSEFQICHYGATEDYAKGYIDCQNNYNKVLFAAAGKGE